MTLSFTEKPTPRRPNRGYRRRHVLVFAFRTCLLLAPVVIQTITTPMHIVAAELQLNGWGRGETVGLDPYFGQATPPPDLSNVVMVSAGELHSLALKADGTVTAWGAGMKNSWPNPGQSLVPSGLTNVISISAGSYHSLALRGDGTVVAWGNYLDNQTNVPVGLSNVMAIAAGGYHNLALLSNGTVLGWGATATPHNYGQTRPPPNLSRVTAVAAGLYHSLALSEDGTIVAWGRNNSGQTNIPSGLTDVVAIAAGAYHNLALRKDGSVVSWGRNTYGETQVPPGITNAVAIAAGTYHSLVLMQDGVIVAWGANSSTVDWGQAKVPANVTKVVRLAAGAAHNLALSNDGQPFVLEQPGSVSIYSGSLVSFRPTVVGAGPLAFQWERDGIDLKDATNLSLSFVEGKSVDNGRYRLRITNPFGTTFSQYATLAVTEAAPIITQQLGNRAALPGETVVWTINATGSYPLSYQWKFNDNIIPGATNNVVVLTNAQPNVVGTYEVVISNPVGSTYSGKAFLTLIEPDELAKAVDATNLIWTSEGPYPWSVTTTNSHDGVAAAQGNRASTLNTQVEGPGTLEFWWNKSGQDCGLSFYLDAETLPSRQVANPPTWRKERVCVGMGTQKLRWVFIPNAAGTKGWLDEVSFTPGGTGPLLSVLPVSNAAQAGGSLTLSASAKGTPPITYAWSFNGIIIKEDTTGTLVLTNLQRANAGTYTLAVSNAFGQTNVTAAVEVFDSLPRIKEQPLSQGAAFRSKLHLRVVAEGSEPFIYKWQRDGQDLEGFTGPELRIENVDWADAGVYRVQVINGLGSISSELAQIIVGPRTVVGWGNPDPPMAATPLGVTNIIAIGAGAGAGLAVTGEGKLVAWGDSSISVYGWNNLVEVAGGWGWVLGLRRDGSVIAEGVNGWGQTSIPTGLTNVIQIAAGQYHALALLANGKAVAWGYGNTNIPPEVTNVVAVATGGLHDLALGSDGRVHGWGVAYHDAGSKLDGVTNVVAIAAGLQHNMALRSDGTVICWGINDRGQTNTPEDLSNVVAITAGEVASYALRDDGSVSAWGDPYHGATQVPLTVTNAIALAAGPGFALALISDGSPAVTIQPRRREVAQGKTLQLYVGATGIHPLSFQWHHNGFPIPNATNCNLVVNSVELADSGEYRCIVTNLYGAVETKSADVNVLRSGSTLVLASIDAQPNGPVATLKITGLTAHGRIVIYRSPDLLQWTPIFTNAPVVGTLIVTDPFASDLSQRFYRALEE